MKRIFGVLGVIALVLLFSAVVAVMIGYTRPLGPSMNLVTRSQPDIIQPSVNQLAAQTKKTCGNTGVMHLVVIGRASPMDINQYGADAVRLVVVNFDTPSAAVLAFPIELWVTSPVLSDQGVEQTQLNLVYQQVWETAHGQPDNVRTQKATEALAQTIYDNFDFISDHYVTVEDAAYIEFIDEVGGVDVTLPEEVDGTSEGYGVYPPGLNQLDGLRTLNLTRLLHPSGQLEPDWWGSLARQDLVLHGMLAATLQPVNLMNLPDLVKALRKVITTDLSVNQAMDLACMLQTVGESTALDMVGPPPHLMTIDEEGRMIPDVEAIKVLLAQMEGGN